MIKAKEARKIADNKRLLNNFEEWGLIDFIDSQIRKASEDEKYSIRIPAVDLIKYTIIFSKDDNIAKFWKKKDKKGKNLELIEKLKDQPYDKVVDYFAYEIIPNLAKKIPKIDSDYRVNFTSFTKNAMLEIAW